MFTKSLLVATLLSVPTFGAVFQRTVVHERVAVPAGWTASSIAARDDAPMLLQIGLVQRNIATLESKLKDVSTPGSSKYGKHLDKEAVDALFAPSASAVKKVRSWLEKSGVESVSNDGHWITFNTTVEKANKLLAAKFKRYVNEDSSAIRTTEYSIPSDLKGSIDLISPTTYFGSSSRLGSRQHTKVKRDDRPTKRSITVDPSCSDGLTPTCLKQLYNIGDYTPCATCGSKIGFGAFENNSARYDDLAKFELAYNISSQNISVNLANGGVDFQERPQLSYHHTVEASQDLDIILAMTHPLPITEFIVGGLEQGIAIIGNPTSLIDPFLVHYQNLLSLSNAELPQVITDSYGNEEQEVPQAYAIRVCNAIGMLGLRGVSVSADPRLAAECTI